MNKKLALFFLIITMAIFTVACGTNSSAPAGTEKEAAASEPETITVKHQLGETTVTKNPEKVVVFDFGVLDSLDKLGVEVTGLPQANVPTYLEKYKDAKYKNAGGLKEPDFEAINEMAPDLIIISGRQQDSYEEFSEIAPTIFMGVDTTRYMDSYKENAKMLGEIFGKEKEVEAELAEVEKAIDSLHEKASAMDKTGLIVLANEGNLSAYGPGSRFGLLHDVFGVKPVDENIEASTHGQNISFEYLLEKDPDYLFVVDRGIAVGGDASAKSVIENKLVENTKAVKNGNVVYLNADYWYLSGGGLISVAEMVKEVEAALQ
ncbi:siderophore ABC transporter substrate-binding protein [Bacillus sp. FJAT-27251]|uniref:siderophore ABC transporter substrate-binding protein n=1 Tax=Bacillus sp. FJAT-27251 TaxID=1684142 RepID=UPI0006A76F20|nr:siderophore ABC transporter substrate-binding protein [Bacillus sp. FJAT-27251]